MPPNSTTSVASTRHPVTFLDQQPGPSSRWATAELRCNSTANRFQLLNTPSATAHSAPGNAQAEISLPVYSGRLTQEDVPEALRKDTIIDQASLKEKWLWTVQKLQTQPVTPREALEILKSGILQKPTGQAFAPLFVEALMRSDWLKRGQGPDQLREFVKTISHLPPEKWAAEFGENANPGIGRGMVSRFVKDQLNNSRQQRDEKISSGELIDDDTWEKLRDLTQQIDFDEFLHVRPSPKDAKALMADFVKDRSEQIPREDWPSTFSKNVQQIESLLADIEVVDNRPDVFSWMKELLEDTTRYLAFGSGDDSLPIAQTKLMSVLQEIESKSSFYSEVDTSGPDYSGSFRGKVLFVINALDAALSLVPKHPKPPRLAIPLITDIPFVDLTVPEMTERVAQLEIEVNDFTSSMQRQSEAGVKETIDIEPTPALATPASAQPAESTHDYLTRKVGELASKIDSVLTFPRAMALEGSGASHGSRWLGRPVIGSV